MTWCPGVQAATDGASVELGTAFTPAAGRQDQGDPVLQGRRQRRHPHRLASGAPRAPGSARSRSPTRPPRGGRPPPWPRRSPCTGGSQYVVSYLAPQGHYSTRRASSPAPYTAGDLTAPATEQRPLRVRRRVPGVLVQRHELLRRRRLRGERADDHGDRPARRPPGATDVSAGAKPSITFSTAIATGYSMTVSAGRHDDPGHHGALVGREDAHVHADQPLPGQTPTLTVTVSGVVSTAGVQSSRPQSWTFHTETARRPAVAALFGDRPRRTPRRR